MRKRLPILLGLILVLLLTWVRLADPYPVRVLRDIAFDTYQQIAPRPAADVPVRIADIDEASLAAFGQWPWSRDVMARLSTRLAELGAAAVAFDVLFPEPDRTSPVLIDRALSLAGPAHIVSDGPLRDYDREFAAALASTPSVLGFGVASSSGPLPDRAKAGMVVVGSSPVGSLPRMPGVVESLPLLAGAAKGMGSISLDPAGTVGEVRRLPLLWTNGTQIFPSLSLEALRVAMGQDSIIVFADPSGQGTVQRIRIGDFELPTATDGSLQLYYRPSSPGLYVSVKDILGPSPQSVADRIAGSIVLVGTSATGLLDIRGTALGADVPGVEIHAQALEQILTHTFLTRADWVDGLEIGIFLLMGVAIVLIVLRSGPWVCLAVAVACGALVVAGSWFAFSRLGLLIDPSFPLAGSFAVYTAMIFFQFTIANADKRLVRQAFTHYLAPSLLTQIEKDPSALKLGGETRRLTVLFLDIRNFTTLSEGIEPEALVTLLNTLFGALGDSITDNLGTIDKFIGDAIMAFWNAPVDVEDHPTRACLAALEMRKIVADLNAADAFHLKGRNQKMEEIAIGIGVATGPALVGNLGIESRFDYSCVGDTVNVASRAEGACKTVAYDIVVAGETRRTCNGLAFLAAGAVELKGKTAREPIDILVGDDELARSPRFAALDAAHAEVIRELAEGRVASEAIDRCVALCPEVDPRLVRFYEALRRRGSDFAAPLAAAIA